MPLLSLFCRFLCDSNNLARLLRHISFNKGTSVSGSLALILKYLLCPHLFLIFMSDIAWRARPTFRIVTCKWVWGIVRSCSKITFSEHDSQWAFFKHVWRCILPVQLVLALTIIQSLFRMTRRSIVIIFSINRLCYYVTTTLFNRPGFFSVLELDKFQIDGRRLAL